MEQATEIKKDSLVKRILLTGGETANVAKFSFLLGAALAGTGRLTGNELLPAVPPALDIIVGPFYPTAERVLCYAAYGAGVATVYADKVYESLADKF